MNTNEIPTPLTDAFKKEWPDHRRHNWPCSFESAAFAEIENIERSLTGSRALSVELVKQLLEVTGQRNELATECNRAKDEAAKQFNRVQNLERQLAETRETLRKESLLASERTRLLHEEMDKTHLLSQDLAELTGQRDSLRDALKDIHDRALDTTISLHPDDVAKGCVDDVLEYAEQALNSLKP